MKNKKRLCLSGLKRFGGEMVRPIKMIMSAFGPFAKEVEVDFDKLGRQGLYLITGDTGAGKTTIFDAIVFALYGEASGTDRESTMFRSKYAKPEAKTFVELTFSYQNIIYTVRRNPEYERPKERGDGMTVQRAEAELIFSDEREPITKMSDVTKAIGDIIGLDRNQFTQIAMLAQGEFRKFLMAPTKEKEIIFRNIFHTGNYQTLQRRLAEEANACKRKYDSQKQRILQMMEDITCEEESENVMSLQQFQETKEIVHMEEFEKLLSCILEEQRDMLSGLDQQMVSNEEELAGLNEKIGLAENLQKAKVELEKLDAFLKNTDQTLNDLKEKERLAIEEAGVCDELTAQAAQIEQKLGDYSKQTKRMEEQKRNEQFYEALKKELEIGQAQLADFAQRLQEKQSIVNEKKDSEKLRLQAEHEMMDLQHHLEDLCDFLQMCKQLEQLQKRVATAQETCKQRKEDYQKAVEVYNHLQQIFVLEQAGILAQELCDQKPCPVCGSLTHPSPAKLSDAGCTKEEIQEKKEWMEQMDQAFRAAGNDAQSAIVLRDAKLEQIQKHAKQLFEHTKREEKNPLEAWKWYQSLAGEKLTKAKEQELILQKSIATWKKDETIFEKANRDIEKIHAQQDKQQTLCFEKKNELTKLESDIAHQKQDLELLKRELVFEDEATAKAAIQKIVDQKEKLQKNREKATKAVVDYDKQIAQQKAKRQALKEQLKTTPTLSFDALIQQRQQLQAKRQQFQADRDRLLRCHKNNEEAGVKALKEWKKINEFEKYMASITSLSDTVNGNLKGKNKIMLETYIQMTYFDRILNRANLRLLKMTDGQYELVRKKGASNQKSQSGLELDVKDYYNGTTRSVQTLSGGESFMASLSLALGLSDEIQMGAGGICLETMFVDEGFGSLDDETLSKAIEVLAGLSRGERLVGIISHVAELKQRVDRQIIVTKDVLNGSKVIQE